MKNHDLLNFTDDLPINIHLYRNDYPSRHWHSNAELIFVLSGTAHMVCDDQAFSLVSEDVVYINPNSIHTITGQAFNLLSLSINLSKLSLSSIDDDHYFELNSSGNTYHKRYNYIRQLIAQLIKINASGENKYMTLSIVYAMIGQLKDHFQVSRPFHLIQHNENIQITEILAYINAHYHENLQLNNIAETFNVSPSYLSSFFKKQTNMTFLNYYNELRMNYAVNDMLTTRYPLETIIFSHGFSDYRSFTQLFKRRYAMLPNQYRKKNQWNRSVRGDGSALSDSTSGLPTKAPAHSELHQSFDSLSKYLYNGDPNLQNTDIVTTYAPQTGSAIIRIDGGSIDFELSGVQLRHTFKEVCTVGNAKQFLYSEMQDIVRKVQSEIGYKHVKFHGILSDEMMVYTERPDGTPVYSFILVDKVIDFLLSVHLKPYMQLSFMPIMLAKDPTKLIDMWHFNTSPPKSLSKWEGLIKAFIQHLLNRYGLEEVASWLYCVWNEPDATIESFGWDDPDAFYEFYAVTYRAVKSVIPTARFGTPSLLLRPSSEHHFALNFFKFSEREHCLADFLNIHYYDNDFSGMNSSNQESFSLENLAKPCPLNEDPFAFTKFINGIKQDQRKLNIDNFPIYLTEWNLTVSQRDLINDTCFKSCYLTKNLLENYDRLESYGYWVLSDFIEELAIPSELYHGGLGMFTYNGIPKAHYNIFLFISKLKDALIAKGKGYFVTKAAHKIVMILYNYEHFSKLFATGILFDMSVDNRYAPFKEMNPAYFTFTFTGLNYNNAIIKEQYVNQNQGSSFDAWSKLGAFTSEDHIDLEFLMRMSQPGLSLSHKRINANTLTLEFQLAPLEVRLIEIDLT